MTKREMHALKKLNYEEIMNRKLGKFYVIMQVVSIDLPLGTGNILEKSKIYVIYGTNVERSKNNHRFVH